MTTSKGKICIFGTSGWSRETLDVCIDMGYEEIAFIAEGTQYDEYYGHRTFGEYEIPRLSREHYVFIIGVGDNLLRRKIASRFNQLKYTNVIHSSATFGYNQRKEIENKKGNIVTAGVRITNDVKMGNFGIFNLNCTVGHNCIIEDFVNIAPGANISGNVKLSEGSYIGTNASILQGKSITEKMLIGRYSTVGAGSVVTKSISDHSIVKGVPAK